MPFARVNGAELYYETLGRGRPLFLLHGSGLEHRFFRPWLDPLQDLVTLVFIDLRGCGRSSPLGPSFAGDATWIEDVDALRLHLNLPPPVVLGHSHGSALALRYASRIPEAVSGLVLDGGYPALDYMDVVLENCGRKGTPEQRTLLADALGSPPSDDEGARAFWRTMAPLYFHRWDASIEARVFDPVRFSGEALSYVIRKSLPEYNALGLLKSIRVPSLVMSGRHDWIAPPAEGGGRLAAGMAGSEFVVFERSGHWPCIEENAAYLDVLRRWLAARTP